MLMERNGASNLLVQTHDWQTGLIPGLAHPDVSTVHTLHNVHSLMLPRSELEHAQLPLYGWDRLFKDVPNGQQVDFQLSGVFGADCIVAVSPAWLCELVRGEGCAMINPDLVNEMRAKFIAGRAGRL